MYLQTMSVGAGGGRHRVTHNSDSLQGSTPNQQPIAQAGLQRRGVASPLLLSRLLHSNPFLLPPQLRPETPAKAPWTAQEETSSIRTTANPSRTWSAYGCS